jgi:hypothetical protein
MDSPMDKNVPHWTASGLLYPSKITDTVVLAIGRSMHCVGLVEYALGALASLPACEVAGLGSLTPGSRDYADLRWYSPITP